ncbi:N-acetyltransferase [Chitinophaga sp. S165]|uniref:GNAT family N-acetyltransferase n=1 Tax=Chitinophaga sp. S165 TaxID=2135462 RepID=UPI000D712711|nr:GNAT family N-acetyltransferase [Chitinophaga sp. S165]PWV51960.1 acetyltransferase (GNAT) family protein [Chitinophaga sp. S165]
MELLYRQAAAGEIDIALVMLKEAAEAIRQKGLDQWSIWLNPGEDQVKWIHDGFANGEFYFVENESGRSVGMFRLSEEDILYWGVQENKAGYIHSLVVRKEFAGQELGQVMMKYVEKYLLTKGINLLRLDCNAANKWLCAYYENAGFVKVGQKQMPHALNNLYEKQLRS